MDTASLMKQVINCSKKVKLERGDAERKAFWRGMRAYQCPICDEWHLTKQGGVLY